jgi:hypothetical protein
MQGDTNSHEGAALNEGLGGTPEAARLAQAAIEKASEDAAAWLRCPEVCDDGWVLGSRSWVACATCHGSGKRDMLGNYVPGTGRKKGDA